MEPIISPWFFYFAGMCNFVLFVSVIGLIISIIAMFVMLGESKKRSKHPVIAAIIFFILIALVPREDTCYKMMVASMVTPNNIKVLEGKVDETADKLLEKIVKTTKELQDGQESKR